MKIEHIYGGWVFFFLVLLAAIFLVFVIPDSHGSLTDGLSAYYNCSDNVLDSAQGFSNLTLTRNASTDYGTGKLGKGCSATQGYWSNAYIDDYLTDSITYCFWFNSTDTTSETYFLVQSYTQTGCTDCTRFNIETSSGNLYGWTYITPTPEGLYFRETSNAYYNSDLFYHVCFLFNDTGNYNEIYVNGQLGENGTIAQNPAHWTNPNAHTWVEPFYIGGQVGLLTNSNFLWEGVFDELGFWDRALTHEEIAQLYNDGVGCNPISNPDGCTSSDPTPEISNIVQSPSNATILNIIESGVNVSATVTQANTTRIFMELKLNGTEQFINGSRLNPNKTMPYNSSNGNVYTFLLQENDLLSYTANLDIALFYSTTHGSSTLNTPNQWVKMEFLNMTYDRPLNFVEIMDTNSSTALDTAEYYACNSSYVSGNPTVNSNCALFYSTVNNQNYSHVHSGNSAHKILPLGINSTSKKIQGIGGTSTLYILKRGNNAGETYFHIPITSRTNAMQVSSNNGVTWVSQNYTVDAHIHFARGNDTFQYRIVANNSLNTITTYSEWSSDIPDLPNLPPIPVIIYNPILAQTYFNNETLLINHSQSFSQSSASIVNYTYWISAYGEQSFTFIAKNDYPLNTYTMSLFLIRPGYYYIRVYASDSNGRYSFTESGVFQVVERYQTSSNQVNMTGVENKLDELVSGMNLLPLVLLYIGFMGFGYHMIMHGNVFSGVLLYGISIGFDFLFIAWYLTTYEPSANMVTIAGRLIAISIMFMFMWIFFKIGSLIVMRASALKYKYTHVKR